jgi:formylglycine-generating enzyme required for sulfatase activity
MADSTAPGASVGGDVHTDGGDFIGRDQVVNNIYVGSPPRDPAEARRIYLGVLARQVSRLPMRAFDAGQANPAAQARELNLINVYTALDTAEQVEREEEGAPPGRRKRQPPQERGLERGETRPLRALEAAAANRCLALLGEPGSGKSTFAHHLIYCLARGGPAGAAWREAFERDWPAGARAVLPVRVILRDFDAWLDDPARQPIAATPGALRDFLAHSLAQQNLGFALPLLDRALDDGQALVVLDGLDEVTSLRKRAFMRDAIAAWAERYGGSRCLVTCRTWSYQPPEPGEADLRLPGFPAAQLAPFDDAKIDAFIGAWHAELVKADKLSPAKAAGLEPRLKKAVRQPDLRRLAGNPLQLTLMAWVHTDDEELPDKRAKLYSKAVDLLLWRWEAQKPAAAGEASLADLARQVDDGDGKGKIERALWKAAYEAHARLTAQDQRDNPDKLADVSESALKRDLSRLKKDARGKPDENWARDVVDAIKARSGLLAQRLPDALTFPHRTFQEYLAGLWLLQDRFVAQAGEKAAQLDVWREVILLAIGHSVYVKQDYELEKPLALVRRLCPSRCEDGEAAWRKVWLAGEALVEMGLARADEQEPDTVDGARGLLARLVGEGKLAPAERARAGLALSKVGDPRFDPRAWHLPRSADGDCLGFIEVPAGPFFMGTRKQDFAGLMERLQVSREDRRFHEHEIWPDDRSVELPRYFIARYPVTVAQFRAFVQAANFEVGDPDCLRDEDTQPVRWVSWREAMAYCGWLNDTFREWPQTPEPLRSLLRGGGWRVTLPSEAEYEKAARGPAPSRRVFAWGDDLPGQEANDYANIAYAGIGTTCAAGAFPRGRSEYGCLDLIGNVGQWTRSEYKPYPYQPREDYAALKDHGQSRVLRGGSFNFDHGFARCACRLWYLPDLRFDYGLRVVVSPILL